MQSMMPMEKRILVLGILVAAILGRTDLGALFGCSKSSEAKAKPAAAAEPAKDGKIAIAVTKSGFEPDGIHVKKGTPYTFVFTRTTDETCAKEVVLQLGGGKTIQKPLPLGQPVEIAASFADAGDLRYACGMDMVKGVVHVE
jgi:plastocyanin domain-containing protein